MRVNIVKNVVLAGIAAILSSASSATLAETFTVKMLNVGVEDTSTRMVFEPAFLQIEVGDTVIFESTDPGHNVASKNGMIPEGIESWNSKIGEHVEMTFDTNGTYGYVCMPHYGMGMVGLILVGDHTVNLEEARAVKQRGRAKRAFIALFEQVDSL